MISISSLIITAAFLISAASLTLAIMALSRIGKECRQISAQFDRHAREIDAIRTALSALEASLRNRIEEVSSYNSGRCESLDNRLRDLEPNRRLTEKTKESEEDRVRQFRGAIGYRKFMEEGIVKN